MKGKPNINDFLEGGAADLADKTKKEQPEKIKREQKIFRLPVDLIKELKREAYERSIKTDSRVTETELVEQALQAFLKR